MAIKDIFTMIKADRYTSDGREELIKAQEAVTEDVTYKPGDISRKTGLQKQPDGSWAPVKNAPAQKKGLGGKTLTKGAKHYPTVGEYAENGPIEQRMAMKKLLEKNDTESGSGLSERAQYSVSQTAAGMSTEALKSHVDKLKNDPVTRNSISNPDAMAKAYEAELAKRKGSASGSAPSADWEKDIPNASNEELVNILKLEEKLPRMSEQSRSEFAPKIEKAKAELYKRADSGSVENAIKHSKLSEAQLKEKLKAKFNWPDDMTMSDAKELLGEKELAREIVEVDKPRDKPRAGSAPSNLKIQGMSKEEYIPWRMKTYKENEAQASSVWNHFAEQQKNKGKENEYDPDFHPLRDSAPRVLTGDCKVRIRKSK